jgi:hypothetical protein
MNSDHSVHNPRQRWFANMAVVFLALFWAGIGFLQVLTFRDSDWQATAGVLMIATAFSGTLSWIRLQALRTAVMPDFLTLILFSHFFLKTLTLLGLTFRALGNRDSLMVDQLSGLLGRVPLEYQFQAELVFLLATIIFTSVWRLQEGKRLLGLWNEPPSKQIWMVYGLSIIGHIVLLISFDRTAVGTLAGALRFFALGAIAVLLGGRGRYALGKPRSWVAIFALVPLMLMSLPSGMKSEVAVVALPILLPIIRKLTFKRVLFLGCFLAFAMLFVFPFSQAWREANWNQSGGLPSDIGDVTSSVIASWKHFGLTETAQISTAQWLSRSSTSEAGGLVMQLADQDGLIGPVLIEGLVTIFIPRFLWPEKPNYAPGAWFTWYLGMASSPETATSSTATLLPTELYWMFGLPGVLIGMTALAMLYFHVWRFMIKESGKGIVPAVAIFALLGRTSGLEEMHTIYAISSPIILVVYVVFFDRLLRLMPSFRNRLNRERLD